MKIDMSAHAVTLRLKKTSELRRLCIALGGERLRSKIRISGFYPNREPAMEDQFGGSGTDIVPCAIAGESDDAEGVPASSSGSAIVTHSKLV
jgi:hypothetical protein